MTAPAGGPPAQEAPTRADLAAPGTAAPDLRTLVLGGAAWVGALAGLRLPGPAVVAVVLTVGGFAAYAAVRGRRTLAAVLLTAAALALLAGARVESARVGPVPGWAEQRAYVDAEVAVRGDPVVRHGAYGDYVVVEARTVAVSARGRAATTAVPVLVVADARWARVELGSRVRASGRLTPADTAEHAAVLRVRRPPTVLHGPGMALRAAGAVRAAVRDAASGPEDAAALVPALVTGDDAGLDPALVEDFRTAGLTHLTAVSGTNLTLVLAVLLTVARWAGVRARGLLVLGLLGVVGFVLLARTEPSVLRAAAMGTVALLGLGAGGRATGVRALGAAVLGLLVVDPWLAASPGFALSALATAGIVAVAPTLRDALARWLPRLAAEAVAVPLAAQLACTPVVVALSGELSLVAVAANLVAAPAVAPATVLGLAGGLVGLVAPGPGRLLGYLAGWSAQPIVVTARAAASLPVPAVPWPSGAPALALLTALTAVATLLAPSLLRHRAATSVATVVLVVLVTVPPPLRGWPPTGWVLVMCDVGQGDALVVATGPHAGVVVDAGPEPRLVRRCLDRLGIRRVPAVVLTHFHADHVAGLPGVLAGRAVGEVEVSALAEPAESTVEVRRRAAEAGIPVRVPAYGETARAGPARWQVLGPRHPTPGNPNDSSLVLLLETRGLRLLLTGDVEPHGQAALRRAGLGRVDVLKVPHHGSAYQDPAFVAGLAPRAALVSVGEDNDYGHPDPALLRRLEHSGALVRRTDRDGDVAVVLEDGRLRVVTRG